MAHLLSREGILLLEKVIQADFTETLGEIIAACKEKQTDNLLSVGEQAEMFYDELFKN